ncbi:lipase secretion chaperone [Pseudomonas sp. BN515]|uniref:lipase secretion chaperone n=1 Tax=Pseudomonas sp. BN515 TaxID=2567892 RepID=UPI0024587B22|nr:lipase secretion chaperone [Pseudomonas sp. BN515]MDH4871923.1 lipase secretion chaperone [Pseudomonas sp. BN515]
MRRLLLLFPIAFAGALAILLQWGGKPAPAASSVAPAVMTTATSTPPAPPPASHSEPLASSTKAPTTRAMPASLSGTAVDGRFHLDSGGNLLITEDIRRIFDYFLSTQGEEPLAGSIQRLRGYIGQQLDAPAEDQALVLLDQYLDYKRQLVQLERDIPLLADLNALRQREAAVQALRARIFSTDAHQAFFASEETYNTFTLQRLAIQRTSLDPAAKAAAIDQLRSALPDELQALAASQLQAELRVQVGALREAGGSPEQIRQLRQQLVGAEATIRLEALDQQRLQWQQRLQSYLKERSRIEASEGLSQSDKAAAIAQLEEEGFNPQERLRLQAAAELAAARKKQP